MEKKKNQIDKENKKILTKLLIGIVVYVIFMTFLIIKIGLKEDEIDKKTYLIMDDVYFYQYEDGKMKPISFLDTDYDDYLFEIYHDGEYSGVFYLSTVKYEYINFTKKGSSGMFRPTIPYIAMTQDIEYIEYKTEEFNNDDIIILKNIMDNKGIYDIGTLGYSYKVTIDLDNDGTEETIYKATNYNYDNAPDDIFSIIYVVDGDQRKILEEYYATYDTIEELSQCNLKYILDLSGDGKYTLVIDNSDYDETYINFYENNGKTFTNITFN